MKGPSLGTVALSERSWCLCVHARVNMRLCVCGVHWCVHEGLCVCRSTWVCLTLYAHLACVSVSVCEVCGVSLCVQWDCAPEQWAVSPTEPQASWGCGALPSRSAAAVCEAEFLQGSGLTPGASEPLTSTSSGFGACRGQPGTVSKLLGKKQPHGAQLKGAWAGGRSGSCWFQGALAFSSQHYQLWWEGAQAHLRLCPSPWVLGVPYLPRQRASMNIPPALQIVEGWN